MKEWIRMKKNEKQRKTFVLSSPLAKIASMSSSVTADWKKKNWNLVLKKREKKKKRKETCFVLKISSAPNLIIEFNSSLDNFLFWSIKRPWKKKRNGNERKK